MTERILPVAIAGLLAAAAARGEEFVCPEGAKDSGFKPNQVVRWCAVERDGRLVFHGPVWRFHRNGRLQAKERFVDGELDGEAWAFWDNGRPSSVGTYDKGERTGAWRSWDEEGRLTREEAYTPAGLVRDEYYPSGKKRASGTIRDGAKVADWYMFEEGGGERARCDFGEGLFALPDDPGCRTIAEELEPRGFARPVPKGAVTEDGVATVTIGARSYAFTTPQGWVADASAGTGAGFPVVFVPQGKSWRDPDRSMWIRIILKEGRTLDVVTHDERIAFAKRVGEYQEFLLPARKGRLGRVEAETLSYTIPTRPDAPFAIVEGRQMLGAAAFLDVSPEVVIVVALGSDWRVPMKDTLPTFLSLVESARPAPAARAGR